MYICVGKQFCFVKICSLAHHCIFVVWGLGWVYTSLFIRNTGMGWVSYLVGWVGSGSMKWTHGQLLQAMSFEWISECYVRYVVDWVGRYAMASSLMVMTDPRSGLSTSAPSSCSSSRPIAARRTGANTIDFSAYLLSTSPPGFELSPGVFTCGLPPSQRVYQSNYFQVMLTSQRSCTYTVNGTSHLTARLLGVNCHGITQCYLPPYTSEHTPP